MLFLIIIVGEEVLGETGEKISTVVGALIIALAHVRNFKACRDKNCNPPKKWLITNYCVSGDADFDFP